MTSALEQSSLRVVLYEGAGSLPLETERRASVLTRLLEKGFHVTCAREQGSAVPADTSSLFVFGQFENGQAPELETHEDVCLHVQAFDRMDNDQLVEKIETFRDETNTRKSGDWLPWFPVIDYDRCTNCMQCLSFCLFGVYGVSDEKEIQVQNQDKCKTNCPACSRVCPEAAIMFPKYRSGPVNGEEVDEDGLEREKMKIDVSALLGGNIYDTLRKRSDQAKDRFSKERDEDRALQERKRCLAKLQKEMDIPTEVLMSLPSVDEIQQRAKDAKAAAEDALNWRNESIRPEERE